VEVGRCTHRQGKDEGERDPQDKKDLLQLVGAT